MQLRWWKYSAPRASEDSWSRIHHLLNDFASGIWADQLFIICSEVSASYTSTTARAKDEKTFMKMALTADTFDIASSETMVAVTREEALKLTEQCPNVESAPPSFFLYNKFNTSLIVGLGSKGKSFSMIPA